MSAEPKVEAPITFEEPCYALLDTTSNAVRMTRLGLLGIFNTAIVARNEAAAIGAHIRVVPVRVTPIEGGGV